MGLRINTNVPSINAQRNLGKTRFAQGRSLEKLSSGFRINRAGDDAAGLAISSALTAQIRGIRQAKRNAADGVSLVQVAEGGLNEIGSILIRMREMAVQSSSDTIGQVERQFIQTEFLQLSSEISRIAEGTEFNSTHLLNGKGVIREIQVGTGNQAMVDRIKFDASRLNATPESLKINLVSLGTKESAQQALKVFDDGIISVSSMRADLGAIQNRLQSTITNLEISLENMSAANSRIKDVDVAEETAELARTNILLQAGTSVLSQANQNTQIALTLLGA